MKVTNLGLWLGSASFFAVFAALHTGCTDCTQPTNQGQCEDSILWTTADEDAGIDETTGQDASTAIAPPRFDGSAGPDVAAAVDGSAALDGSKDGGATSNPDGSTDGDATSNPDASMDADASTDADSSLAQGKDGAAPDAGSVVVDSTSFESGESIAGWVLGTWQEDNLLGAHDGQIAIHPPSLKAGDAATATFDCDGLAHVELTFWYEQVAETAAGAQALDVLIDGAPYATIDDRLACDGCAPAWSQAILDVPVGTHTYSFTARSTVDVSPPFVLDSFVCLGESAGDR